MVITTVRATKNGGAWYMNHQRTSTNEAEYKTVPDTVHRIQIVRSPLWDEINANPTEDSTVGFTQHFPSPLNFVSFEITMLIK